MSATSAFPTLTGSFTSCFFPPAFIATNVMTMATTSTMLDQTATFFFRLPLIEISSIRLLPALTSEKAESFRMSRGRQRLDGGLEASAAESRRHRHCRALAHMSVPTYVATRPRTSSARERDEGIE